MKLIITATKMSDNTIGIKFSHNDELSAIELYAMANAIKEKAESLVKNNKPFII